MNDYILSRQILVIVFCLHCLLTYLGSTVKANVSAKVYGASFLTWFLVLTGYIIYTCIVEPFHNGVIAGVFGYVAVYFSLWFLYEALRHWIIVPNKIYDFYPKDVREWDDGSSSVDGYIMESDKKIFVYVDDEDLCKNMEKGVPVKVKYREWKDFAAHCDIVKTDI